MRLIHVYLIACFVPLAGAGLTLWQTGALSRIAPLYLVLGGGISIGIGVLLAVVDRARSRVSPPDFAILQTAYATSSPSLVADGRPDPPGEARAKHERKLA